MSLDGTSVAIGAAYNNGNNKISSGHVRVYYFNKVANSWEQRGPDVEGKQSYEYLSQSLQLSSDGTILAVSAIEDLPFEIDLLGLSGYPGSVRVYLYADNNWKQLGNNIKTLMVVDDIR